MKTGKLRKRIAESFGSLQLVKLSRLARLALRFGFLGDI